MAVQEKFTVPFTVVAQGALGRLAITCANRSTTRSLLAHSAQSSFVSWEAK